MTKILELLSKKWTLLILRELSDGSAKRFSDISNQVETINPRILSQRLKELEEANIISKKRFKELPPKVEYKLTIKGKDLLKCFTYLDKWVIKWK